MSKPVLIPIPSLAIGLDVVAIIRHGAMRDLTTALRKGERVPESVEETIRMMDTVGAAWANRSKSDVSSNVSSVAAAGFVPVEWDAVTVKTAATELGISTQAVGRLLGRDSLHGEKSGRTWRVCVESVRARKEGIRCQH
jgi:hypothetical protein